jgi:hypothetical protein
LYVSSGDIFKRTVRAESAINNSSSSVAISTHICIIKNYFAGWSREEQAYRRKEEEERRQRSQEGDQRKLQMEQELRLREEKKNEEIR